MKHFGIYQLFIDPIKGERNLLVGFSTADIENAAVKNFTSDEFRQGYLKAVECNKVDFTKQHLIDAIERNISEIGAWAKSQHELSGLHLQGVSNHVKNTVVCCSNCEKCTIYEDENCKPSYKFYCKDTEDFINDIEQYYCDNFVRE